MQEFIFNLYVPTRVGFQCPFSNLTFDIKPPRTLRDQAVIIGGASFFGGVGKIPKVVIGGLIIGVINNGLNMVGVSSYYQQLAMGCLLILAVTLDRFFGASRKN